jgi:hypothetical protein
MVIDLNEKSYGNRLSTNWYKVGIQTPYFAQLGGTAITGYLFCGNIYN